MAATDFDVVRRIGKTLTNVEETTMYGQLALKTCGRMIACIPSNKQAEPGSLVVRVDFETRDELIESAPDVYYLKDHYKKFPAVLVRLSRVGDDELRDLLRMAWKIVTQQGPPKSSSKKARSKLAPKR